MSVLVGILVALLVIIVIVVGVFLLFGGTFNYEYHKDGELVTKTSWPRKKDPK